MYHILLLNGVEILGKGHLTNHYFPLLLVKLLNSPCYAKFSLQLDNLEKLSVCHMDIFTTTDIYKRCSFTDIN
jgi:hypothetical protein